MIVYDIETQFPVLDEEEKPETDILYCPSWTDFKGMGISCIGVFDYKDQRYRVFLEDNIWRFKELVKDSENWPLVGFGNISFDNEVLRVNGIDIPDVACIDIKRVVVKAAGFEIATRPPGFGLNALCKANGIREKSGEGKLAPVWWQRKQLGKLIDYNLNDVLMTVLLFNKVIKNELVGPNNEPIKVPDYYPQVDV